MLSGSLQTPHETLIVGNLDLPKQKEFQTRQAAATGGAVKTEKKVKVLISDFDLHCLPIHIQIQ